MLYQDLTRYAGITSGWWLRWSVANGRSDSQAQSPVPFSFGFELPLLFLKQSTVNLFPEVLHFLAFFGGWFKHDNFTALYPQNFTVIRLYSHADSITQLLNPLIIPVQYKGTVRLSFSASEPEHILYGLGSCSAFPLNPLKGVLPLLKFL